MSEEPKPPGPEEPDPAASSDITGGESMTSSSEFLPPEAPPSPAGSPPPAPPAPPGAPPAGTPPPPAAPRSPAAPPPPAGAPPLAPTVAAGSPLAPPPGPPLPGGATPGLPPPPAGPPPPPGWPSGGHVPSSAEYGGPPPPVVYGEPPMIAVPGGTYLLSGWWRRVGAYMIDVVVILIGGLLLVGILAGLGAIGGKTTTIVGVIIGVIAYFAVALLYAPLLMARTNGQTLGKMAAGIRVIRADGRRMDFGWAALREVAVKGFGVGLAAAFTFYIAFFLNYLWPLWDAQHQALHDMVCGTRVVRE